MKKSLLFLIVLFSIAKSNGQSYMGYFPDNYAGVQGVLFNPATIVDSRFKTDINLFSVSAAVGNDLYGVNLLDATKSGYDFDTQAKMTPTTDNNGITSFDAMGPSFMFNLAPKHSLAIFTRARTFSNVVGVNGNLVDEVKNGLDDADNFLFKGGNPNGVSNSWGEIGLSYAAVLWNNNQNFLKGGLTVKYLQGGVNGYINSNDVSAGFVKDNVNPGNSQLVTTGMLTLGSSQDFVTNSNNDFKFDANSMGVGFDLGFVYEWRPDYQKYDLNNAKPVDNNFKSVNKYKLRFGVSVTDIGSINYKNAQQDTYNLNGVVTQDMIDAADNLYDFLEANYTKVSTSNGGKTNLPTAFHANVDWNIHNKFYLNLNGDISLINKNTINGNSIANSVSLIPRYESRWFTFSLPISYMEYSGTQVGTAVRFGPIFVGSSSVITNLVSDDSKAADFYVGIKYPVYQKKFKDTDEDGVLDKFDDCPLVAGPVENHGCPWPDTDGDKVFDKDDACVNVAGPVENKGCPWGDADKDTVLDNVDACVNVAGPVENKGCPWPDTDGDGVLDKDDKCPTVAGPVSNAGCPIPVLDADGDTVPDDVDGCPLLFGPVENKGCPKVTEATLEQLRVEARSIFFNTGKATLSDARKGETSGRLDAIKEILINYPNAKFAINGYTDNVGNPKANLKLSEARAKVVMDALIAKGVNPANLTSKGFGDQNPVKSNETPEGRAENRRTEIVYIGGVDGTSIVK
ncbi:DUF5723 family protein [Flavobacterium sp. N3904]|uniref:DUF5723 family protein n=1 Tax=Flavobacterium sp. N3904 TaxID=2986835 RepID=UPI0022247358|nr:DUF5723 family protein [Flavobacterium sp. N3904]